MKKPYPITSLTGGIVVNKDPILISDGASPNIILARFNKGIVKKDWGVANLGLPLLGVPLQIIPYSKVDGTTYWMTLTTTSVYCFNTTTSEWDDYTEGATLDDCEAAWTASANVTATADTTLYKRGSKSCKLVIAAGFTTGLAAYYNHATSADLTGSTHIHMWVYSTIALAAGDIKFYIDDTDACASPAENIAFPAISASTWTRVSLAIGTPAGLGTVHSWGLNVAVDKGACTIYFDDIRNVKELTGSADQQISSTILNDYFIFTNGKDVMKKFNGTTVADLGGSPPIAKWVIAFRQRLVVCGTTEGGQDYPFRVRWSSIGTIETWSGGTSGYQDVLDTVDWCVCLHLIGTRCFLWKEKTIWEVLYVGGTGVFDIRKTIDNIGTFAGKSLVGYGTFILAYGPTSVYTFDQTSIESQSDSIFPLLFETGEKIINLAYVNRVNAIHVEETGEYWISFPTTTSTPDTLLKLNLKEKSWVRRNDLNITALGYYESTASKDTWASASGTWATYVGSWRSKALSGSSPVILLGDNSGQIYKDDHATKDSGEMVFETKDFIFGHATRLAECRVEARQGAFTLEYSTDGGSSWSTAQSFAYQSSWTEFNMPLNVTVQTIRFRLKTSAGDFEMRWIEPWYIERKRSLPMTFS